MKPLFFGALLLQVSLILFAPSQGWSAEAINADYTIRIVTFSALEAEAVPAALATEPQRDEDLFYQMAEMAGTGSAEVVTDMIARSGPGNWKVQALAETPYPTEFSINSKWKQVVPTSFTFRNAGTTISGSITPAEGDQPAMCRFEWSRTHDMGSKPFQVITQKTPLTIDQPVFFDEKIEGGVPIVNGQWGLAGMTRPIVKDGDERPRRTFLTFVQTWDGTSARRNISFPQKQRLHWFVFRVPVAEVMEWALDPKRDDEALLERLLVRAAAGEVSMDGHAACLVSSAGASKSESIHEYVYATGFNPNPSSFTFRNLGHTLKLSRLSEPGKPSGGIRVSWETGNSLREIPLSPRPGIWSPEFSREAAEVSVLIESGGARLAAATMIPGNDAPGMMHVFFIRNAGPAPRKESIAAGYAELHAVRVSLPRAEAARIAAGTKGLQWEEVSPLINAGSARIIAWQTLAGMAGSTGRVDGVVEAPVAAKAFSFPEHGGLVLAGNTLFHDIGQTLNMHLPGSGTVAFDGHFRVGLNRPEPPSGEMLREALKTEGKLPQDPFHVMVFPPTDKKPVVISSGLQVISLAPCTIRPGNPEHDRWHAVVVILRR